MSLRDTLTSLAMLKVNIDQGRDYLDYLVPFVVQVLADSNPESVTDQLVRELVARHFGLEIPERTVQLVLRRLARKRLLTRGDGKYRVARPLDNPGIGARKAEAERHIQAVVNGLVEFSKSSAQPIASVDEAVSAITTFLSEFAISCVRAYLRGTAIPSVPGRRRTHLVLVGNYVIHLQQSDPERFNSLLVMVQGHMLANALLCPDLQDAPKSYNGVTFYLDTPLLVQRFGLEGEARKRAVEEVIAMVKHLGGVTATFEHSRDEVVSVVRGAAEHIERTEGRGAVVLEARRRGTTKSDLLLLAGRVDLLLEDAGINVIEAPPYGHDFQMDEPAFGQILEDEVNYYNPRAREYDIKSVRSIYELRHGLRPDSVERSAAVLVSSNAAFARAAYDYGKRHEETREVSSVITDFSLANMAWLKAPLGAPAVPRTEVLAYSYAALRPTQAFLDSLLREVDKLQAQGKLTTRDHQLLRSSSIAYDELVKLTLGDDAALTEETVGETLRRVSEQIKAEETGKLREEQEAHRLTTERLDAAISANDSLQRRVYWQCSRNARFAAWGMTGVVIAIVVVGIAAGLGLRGSSPTVGYVLFGASLILALAGLANLVVGTTVRDVHRWIFQRSLTYLLRRESKATGVQFGVF